MEAWLLTAISFTVLGIFWRCLIWTLDLVGRASRALSEPRNIGASHTEGKVLCD